MSTQTQGTPPRPPIWRRRWFWIVVVIVLVVGGLANACGGSGKPRSAPSSTSTATAAPVTQPTTVTVTTPVTASASTPTSSSPSAPAPSPAATPSPAAPTTSRITTAPSSTAPTLEQAFLKAYGGTFADGCAGLPGSWWCYYKGAGWSSPGNVSITLDGVPFQALDRNYKPMADQAAKAFYNYLHCQFPEMASLTVYVNDVFFAERPSTFGATTRC